MLISKREMTSNILYQYTLNKFCYILLIRWLDHLITTKKLALWNYQKTYLNTNISQLTQGSGSNIEIYKK